MRHSPTCISLSLAALLWAQPGCDDGGSGGPADVTPPTTTLSLRLPAGTEIAAPVSPFQATTAEVSVTIAADEPARIFYTTDGTEPSQADRNTGRSFAPARLTLTQDTQLRWFAVDDGGNVSEARQFQVLFDRDPPILTITPEAGNFDRPLTVTADTNEPATVYWTTNGDLPAAGQGSTKVAQAPVDFEVRQTSTVRIVAVDVAGNRTRVESRQYVVDSAAPTTNADPPAGHYLDRIVVTLAVDDPTATIHYTTNGSVPDEVAPVYEGPIEIEETTTLRFSAVDQGGNRELGREAVYTIGPRPAAPVSVPGDRYAFDAAGGLALGAALIEAAGPLSGVGDRALFGADWQAYSTGRDLLDAFLFQSGIGPHAMHSQTLADLSLEGFGEPDTNGNGTPLDDTYQARLQALAEWIGAEAPADVFLASVVYAGGRSRLQRPTSGRLLDDGRPDWVTDYGQLRWSGADTPQRTYGAPTLAAGVAALAARARSALAGEHIRAEDVYNSQVAPVLGLRCGGCHAVGGLPPTLVSAGQFRAAGLFGDGPDDSPILGLLDGSAGHPVDPAMPAEVSWVRDWLASEQDAALGEAMPGVSPEQGLLGLLALEHATVLLGDALRIGIYDPEARRISELPASPTGNTYVPQSATVTEGGGPNGLPNRLETIRVTERAFHTAAQAQLLDATRSLLRLGMAHGDLFAVGGPLGPVGPVESPVAAADRLLRQQVRALARKGWSSQEGTYRATLQPDDDAETFTAVAAADAAAALFQTRAMNLTGVSIGQEPARAAQWLVATLRDLNGSYLSTPTDGRGTARTLETQMAVLRALLVVGETEAADALWAHLESAWWDAEAGLYVTRSGQLADTYPVALVARVVQTLTLASARYPEALERLAAFHAEVVRPLVNAETWLQGETGSAPDSDGDGVLKPSLVPVGNGVAATVAPSLRR